MKKLMTMVTLVALICAGCQTTDGGKDYTGLIKTASYAGTAIALREHPEWRGGFQTAQTELQFLASQESIDWSSVLIVVHRLPVKELQSQDAALIITGASLLLSEYGKSISLNTEKAKPVVLALIEGIQLGMSAVPTRPSVVTPQSPATPKGGYVAK